ncbi:hypothetical protein L1987_13550 [Smallanthus sonchifolius]|uniref:Uncharacterized protein n=1 Tax=Smallanthus sonchifolius TaxID=185202 RepID=A0ACB9JKB1_9ASTR|nr:hypothetical protein L1987_13550 [Smallanthus sonchifolius]
MFVIWAGGIEEDIIKCLAYRGDFSVSCADLSSIGLNRVGERCEDVRKVVADLKSKGASAVGVASFCWGGAVDSTQLWLLECAVYVDQCHRKLGTEDEIFERLRPIFAT